MNGNYNLFESDILEDKSSYHKKFVKEQVYILGDSWDYVDFSGTKEDERQSFEKSYDDLLRSYYTYIKYCLMVNEKSTLNNAGSVVNSLSRLFNDAFECGQINHLFLCLLSLSRKILLFETFSNPTFRAEILKLVTKVVKSFDDLDAVESVLAKYNAYVASDALIEKKLFDDLQKELKLVDVNRKVRGLKIF